MAEANKIGLQLKRARQARGLTFDEPAAELCIRQDQLKALERGNYSIFASFTYAIGFLRLYADYLGLDPAPLVEAVKAEAPAEPVQIPKDAVIKVKNKSPLMPVVAFSLSLSAAVSAFYFGWDAMRGAPERASMVPDLPSHLARLLQEDEAPAAPRPQALLSNGGAAFFESLAARGQPAETVRILAVQDVEIAVTDVNGGVLREGVLYSGESVEVPQTQGFRVITEELSALAFYLADTRSTVAAVKERGLFLVSLDQVKPGPEDPVPAS